MELKFIHVRVDPQMNGLIGGVGGPIMPIVRYFWFMYIYKYSLKSCENSNTVLYIKQ
jgi:hypothetical protein